MLVDAISTRLRRQVRRARFTTRFSGTWEDRLSGLFDCGVRFTGKRILDAGCNMGLVAYEVSKHRPADIHGIDRYRRAITVARRLFLAVDVPSCFDAVNVLDARRVDRVLRPQYDVVLMLALWQHIDAADPGGTARFVARIAKACREALVFRGAEEVGARFEEAVAPFGLTLAYRGPRLVEHAGPILVFRPAARANGVAA